MACLLFDSDAPANPPETRTFNVRSGTPMLITAAGLAPDECVPIFVRVGVSGKTTGAPCHSCGVDDPDFLWSPLSRCGSPVQLCGDANEHMERIPGTYMVGDPVSGVTVAGDVNIASQELSSQYLHVAPYCSGPPPCDPLILRGIQAAW